VEHREIVNKLKYAILAGEIPVGAKLPAVRELSESEEWGASHTTATRALRTLQMEGFAVAKGPAGTFAAMPGGDIILRMPIVGTRLAGVHTPGGTVTILSAGLVDPPHHVRDALVLEDGDQAIRREGTITRDGKVLRLSVGWWPGSFAESCPELLTTEHVWAGDLIKQRIGRFSTAEMDRFYAVSADEHQASVLGISEGVPLLSRETRWHDDDGMIEFGEAVYPPGVSVGAEYVDGDLSRSAS
jgi:DNA-binding GntR family transcriptional regulator